MIMAAVFAPSKADVYAVPPFVDDKISKPEVFSEENDKNKIIFP